MKLLYKFHSKDPHEMSLYHELLRRLETVKTPEEKRMAFDATGCVVLPDASVKFSNDPAVVAKWRDAAAASRRITTKARVKATKAIHDLVGNGELTPEQRKKILEGDVQRTVTRDLGSATGASSVRGRGARADQLLLTIAESHKVLQSHRMRVGPTVHIEVVGDDRIEHVVEHGRVVDVNRGIEGLQSSRPGLRAREFKRALQQRVEAARDRVDALLFPPSSAPSETPNGASSAAQAEPYKKTDTFVTEEPKQDILSPERIERSTRALATAGWLEAANKEPKPLPEHIVQEGFTVHFTLSSRQESWLAMGNRPSNIWTSEGCFYFLRSARKNVEEARRTFVRLLIDESERVGRMCLDNPFIRTHYDIAVLAATETLLPAVFSMDCEVDQFNQFFPAAFFKKPPRGPTDVMGEPILPPAIRKKSRTEKWREESKQEDRGPRTDKTSLAKMWANGTHGGTDDVSCVHCGGPHERWACTAPCKAHKSCKNHIRAACPVPRSKLTAAEREKFYCDNAAFQAHIADAAYTGDGSRNSERCAAEPREGQRRDARTKDPVSPALEAEESQVRSTLHQQEQVYMQDILNYIRCYIELDRQAARLDVLRKEHAARSRIHDELHIASGVLDAVWDHSVECARYATERQRFIDELTEKVSGHKKAEKALADHKSVANAVGLPEVKPGLLYPTARTRYIYPDGRDHQPENLWHRAVEVVHLIRRILRVAAILYFIITAARASFWSAAVLNHLREFVSRISRYRAITRTAALTGFFEGHIHAGSIINPPSKSILSSLAQKVAIFDQNHAPRFSVARILAAAVAFLSYNRDDSASRMHVLKLVSTPVNSIEDTRPISARNYAVQANALRTEVYEGQRLDGGFFRPFTSRVRWRKVATVEGNALDAALSTTTKGPNDPGYVDSVCAIYNKIVRQVNYEPDPGEAVECRLAVGAIASYTRSRLSRDPSWSDGRLLGLSSH